MRPHVRLICFVITVVLLGFSNPATARIYKWVDAEGRVHYSNIPPPGSKSPPPAALRSPARTSPAEPSGPAYAQEATVLIAPPLDETFGKHSGLLMYFTANPSDEENRTKYMSKMPPEEFEQVRALIKRIAEEPSIEKRFTILIESLIDKKAPVGDWERGKAFDSAKSCEDFRSRNNRVLRELEKQGRGEAAREGLPIRLGWAQIRAGRCVPASS